MWRQCCATMYIVLWTGPYILPMFTVHTHTCRRPISACWYVTTPGSVTYHPVDPDPTDQPSPAPSHNFTCRVMNDVFLLEPMSFPTAGQYVFVAEFHNSASQANNTVSFEVVQGEWFLVCSIVFKIHYHSMHSQIISIEMHELLHVECTLIQEFPLGYPWPNTMTKHT